MRRLELSTGDVVSRKYRVESQLGRGGMGVVVLATHLGLNRRVALKVLSPDLADDDDSVERFAREARASVQLTSEHSVRVLDVDRLDDGTPYMVMEFLVGRTLEQVLEERGAPLPVEEAVDYVLQACEAIAEAHALSIVHRDLKLGNLFLTRRANKSPLIKVLDFGLAKALDVAVARALSSDAEGDAGELTKAHAMMGSPAYMSPEQSRSSRDVDERTDLWSLGVCLYELVTGRVPFSGTSIAVLSALIRTGQARPPHEIDAAIPPGLSGAIMRCLEKNPADRFQTLTDLAVAIERYAPSAALRADDVRAALARTRPGTTKVGQSEAFEDRETVKADAVPRMVATKGSTARGEQRRGTIFGVAAGLLAALAVGAAWLALRRGVDGRERASEVTVDAAPQVAVAASGEGPASAPPGGDAAVAAVDTSAAGASARATGRHPVLRPPPSPRALDGGKPTTHPGSDRF